ncbi:MAG TPA: hypothetical protein DDX54_03275 [Rhodospirillaceae bacterium]|jgi:hypothetical protein|nr:hypothetical protein [Alphaproteobacteria bacterium]HBH26406.1 hypothetical protein [Rhodospirillaceae bacterium]
MTETTTQTTEPEAEDPAALAQRLEALAANNRRMGWALAVGGAVVLCLAALIVFWPQSQEDAARLAAIEAELEATRAENTGLQTMLPEDWQARMDTLQAQAEEAAAAAQALTQALPERLAALEAQIDSLGEPEAMLALAHRIGAMSGSAQGQAQISAAVGQLQGALAQPGRAVDAALAGARQHSALLSRTFAGVPDKDLKAAALLLALTQVRGALARGGEPFADDLALLQGLVGEGDPALTAAIERLAPQAEAGVLTPQGLLAEFQGLAGEAVEASLKGEDVALGARAAARFHSIVQVKKGGVPVTGTSTQAAIGAAETRLAAGDVAGAVDVVEGLPPSAQAVLGPWLDKARATTRAQDAGAALDALLMGEIGQGTLVQDEALGITIYRPGALPGQENNIGP